VTPVSGVRLQRTAHAEGLLICPLDVTAAPAKLGPFSGKLINVVVTHQRHAGARIDQRGRYTPFAAGIVLLDQLEVTEIDVVRELDP
jgi:hypothetical protein